MYTYIYAAAYLAYAAVFSCHILPVPLATFLPQGLQSVAPASISSFYAQLCCTATKAVPSSVMTQQLSLHHYSVELQTAAAVQQKAVKAFTNNARHAVVIELTS